MFDQLNAKYTRGNAILCRDFVRMNVGDVIWCHSISDTLDGPFEIAFKFPPLGCETHPQFVLTDAEKLGVLINFKCGLNMDSECGFVFPNIGQVGFFHAVRASETK